MVHGINGDMGGVVGEGGVYCAMGVQLYCNRVGFAGGVGNKRMIDSHTKHCSFEAKQYRVKVWHLHDSHRHWCMVYGI